MLQLKSRKGERMEKNEKKRSFKEKVILDAKTWRRDISFKDLGILFVWSMCVNLIIEILAQFKYGGFFEAFVTLAHNPLVFLYNSFIIMVTISICQLFKRSYFWMVLLSFIWIGFGVANYIILSYRVTPFSAVELKLLDAAMGVMKSYASLSTVIMVILMVVLAVAAIVWLWKKAPVKKYVNFVSSIVSVVALVIFLNLFTNVALAADIISTKLPNLSQSYVKYGFVYCFSESLINTGINKPKDYSEKKVTAIKDSVDQKLNTQSPQATSSEAVDAVQTATNTAVDVDKLPNIIFLQLESFFDITKVERLKFSEDPIPFFRECMDKYSSGYLSVPSVGAGTANTEFEIITGMDLDFFGPGEYPYKTVLKERTCETICYDLKPYGYTTQAMHDNRASFYGRNEVFSQFGFDYFTSMELMNIQEYTSNGWAKDKILTGELLKALKGTENKDYIYTISVQGHGGYPTEPSMEEQKIQVTDGYKSESEKNATQYYTNQIYEMDLFLKELTEALTKYKEESGEDVILVCYGDHLPTLYFEEEDLQNKNQYQTQYFVWNTMDLPVVKEDIEAYQLSSRIMEKLGINEGEINSYHQANKKEAIDNNEKYLEDLQVLGYDMFYGDNYFNGGENVYTATNLKYGVENVSINNVYRDQSDNDYLIIKGKDFTKYSAVYINDEKVDSEFLDENTLRVGIEKVTEDINVVVKQSYKGKLILQTSNSIIYTAAEDESLPAPVDNDESEQQTPSPTEDDLAGMIEEQVQSGNK